MKNILRICLLIGMLAIPADTFGQIPNSIPCEHSDGQPKWCDTILPITLVSFDAEQDGTMVAIKWRTTDISQHAHYIIERSYDLKKIEKIAITKEDHFEDRKVTGNAYYRLVEVALDGTETRYGFVFVRFISPVYQVWTIHGAWVGEYNDLQEIPVRGLLVINGRLWHLT